MAQLWEEVTPLMCVSAQTHSKPLYQLYSLLNMSQPLTFLQTHWKQRGDVPLEVCR